MKKIIGLSLFSIFLLSCNGGPERVNSTADSSEGLKAEVGTTIDQWHKAATKADFDAYFSLMTEDAVYIGTDASENWSGKEFKKFAEPHFKSGKAWDFTKLKRHIFFSENNKTAWFDELLKTHMGLCRGSGVLIRENGSWKIKHYVLSMTIPNDQMKKVAHMKRDFDDSYIEKSVLRK